MTHCTHRSRVRVGHQTATGPVTPTCSWDRWGRAETERTALGEALVLRRRTRVRFPPPPHPSSTRVGPGQPTGPHVRPARRWDQPRASSLASVARWRPSHPSGGSPITPAPQATNGASCGCARPSRISSPVTPRAPDRRMGTACRVGWPRSTPQAVQVRPPAWSRRRPRRGRSGRVAPGHECRCPTVVRPAPTARGPAIIPRSSTRRRTSELDSPVFWTTRLASAPSVTDRVDNINAHGG